MADDTQQQPQPPPDLNAALRALIQQQIAVASGQGPQVQLPSAQPPPSQYSNDPSKGPDLLSRIGLAIGGGSLPGAPAELRSQLGAQSLMDFGIGLLGAGRFATPGEVLAGGLRSARGGLLGSEAAQAGQQEYALGAQTKLAELGMEQQKNRTAALTALVPLLQMQGRLGLPSLFGGGGGAGGPGGDTALTGDWEHDQPIIAKRESGGDPTALNYVAKADPSAWNRGATATGKYQMVQSTWDEGKRLAGIDASKYPTARDAPEAVQDQVAKAVYDKHGTAPWDASKFGANWVQQPDGTYQLVKGAPPPASGPGSAPTGPYKPTTAPPAASGPPGVQMGGPPPAPPGGASGGAPYPESGAGIGRVLTGTEGVPGRQQVTVAPPPSGQGAAFPAGRLQTTGRVPGAQTSAADAMMHGIQTAQATPLVRGTGEEAGPSSAVATLAQPPAAPSGGTAAQPGWGAKVGAYDFGGPTGPVTVPPAAAPGGPVGPQPAATPTAPPAAQAPAPPPAPTPAPASRAHDYSVQDTELNGNEFLDRYFRPATPEEVARLAPGPTGRAAVDAATNVQEARANLTAMQTAANQAHAAQLGATDINRANENVNKAQEAVAKAQTAYDAEVQDLASKGADRLQKRDQAEQQRVADLYKAQVLEPRSAAALERQRGETQKDIERIKTGADLQRTLMQPDLDRLKTMATQSDEMTNMGVNLQQLRAVLPNLPDSGWGAAIAQHLSPTAIGWMRAAGMGDPGQMNAIQSLNGLAAYLSVQMRPTGSGALRNQEMDKFIQALPNLSQDAVGRQKALAFLTNYAGRVQDENQFANEYFMRPKADGTPTMNLIGLERAMNAPKSQGGLGEVVPHAPPMSAGPEAAQKFLSGIDSGRPYYAWAPKVDKSGTPIRNERGQVVYDYDLAVKP